MRPIINTVIEDSKSRLNGYVMLLNFKYNNLCVKAEGAALLGVDVRVDGTVMDLEKTATVMQPRDDQFLVIPNDPYLVEPIIKGIFEMHPEFKMEMKFLDEDIKDPSTRHMLYTMPEVNKDRRDLLVQAVDSLYDETKVQLELTANKDRINLINDLQGLPAEEIEEVEEAMDDAYNQYKDMAGKIHEEKVKEIEDGYGRYLENHPEQEWTPAPYAVSPQPTPSPEKPSAEPSRTEQTSTPTQEDEEVDYDVKKGFRMY